METNIDFLLYLAHFFLQVEMFMTKVVEKIRTLILYSITFFVENRVVCEIMLEKYCRAGQATDVNMTQRVACWIPKATNTHTMYVIVIAFSLKKWLHGPTSMLRYT
jgi:hypothetical protein